MNSWELGWKRGSSRNSQIVLSIDFHLTNEPVYTAAAAAAASMGDIEDGSVFFKVRKSDVHPMGLCVRSNTAALARPSRPAEVHRRGIDGSFFISIYKNILDIMIDRCCSKDWKTCSDYIYNNIRIFDHINRTFLVLNHLFIYKNMFRWHHLRIHPVLCERWSTKRKIERSTWCSFLGPSWGRRTA